MKRTTAVAGLAGVVMLCASGGVAAARGFHYWTDATGRARVSNVAPAGVREDGSVREAWHPNSIAAQHRRLREELARRDTELARRAAAPARSPDVAGPGRDDHGD
ncbi:MAG: hypothetical protein RLW61_02475 [Gammaproteobacteria bacterium]